MASTVEPKANRAQAKPLERDLLEVPRDYARDIAMRALYPTLSRYANGAEILASAPAAQYTSSCEPMSIKVTESGSSAKTSRYACEMRAAWNPLSPPWSAWGWTVSAAIPSTTCATTLSSCGCLARNALSRRWYRAVDRISLMHALPRESYREQNGTKRLFPPCNQERLGIFQARGFSRATCAHSACSLPRVFPLFSSAPWSCADYSTTIRARSLLRASFS